MGSQRPNDVTRDGFYSVDSLNDVHAVVVGPAREGRDVLAGVLAYCGALVTVVRSAPEALKTLRRVTPDVLVADIAMPKRDGYWLIEQVRALPPDQGGRLPAVAITAHGDEHGPARTLPAGFDVHVRKPIDPRELCHVLGTLVRRA